MVAHIIFQLAFIKKGFNCLLRLCLTRAFHLDFLYSQANLSHLQLTALIPYLKPTPYSLLKLFMPRPCLPESGTMIPFHLSSLSLTTVQSTCAGLWQGTPFAIYCSGLFTWVSTFIDFMLSFLSKSLASKPLYHPFNPFAAIRFKISVDEKVSKCCSWEWEGTGGPAFFLSSWLCWVFTAEFGLSPAAGSGAAF